MLNIPESEAVNSEPMWAVLAPPDPDRAVGLACHLLKSAKYRRA
jgi:hypothetical protein